MNNPIKFSLGDIVKSVSGRDKGRHFVVMCFENNLVGICDGKLRKTHKIKKKNPKHIKYAGAVLKETKEKIGKGEKIIDAEIRQEIKNFESK
ncbi:MAG: KOW domain-containing RNA-binding protein [Clostridia bacterium]|nr:KOW domain-containing RNA-binding protein [Clostridia bacterium]